MTLGRLAALGAFVMLPLQVGTAAAQQQQQQPAPKHHSKIKGAIVGAAAGHVLGHHAKAGAVAGAVIQHERNKHSKQPR